MTTHIMFPALDEDLPSTLSPRIITGLLRQEWGYDGVITTDCMEMKAIADNWGTPEGAVLAVLAGVDIVLVGHTLEVQRKVREALLRAVTDGRIGEDRIDESLRRIALLKQRYCASARHTNPDTLSKVLRRPEHLQLQKTIAEHAVTLVRNEGGIVPLSRNESVLVTGLHETVATLADALHSRGANVSHQRLQSSDEDSLSSLLDTAANADAVVCVTCPNEPWKPPGDQALQTRLVQELGGYTRKLLVVAVREPYELRKFPQAPAYLCAYGYRGGMIDAAAALIMGQIEARGRLPVTLPRT